MPSAVAVYPVAAVPRVSPAIDATAPSPPPVYATDAELVAEMARRDTLAMAQRVTFVQSIADVGPGEWVTRA